MVIKAENTQGTVREYRLVRLVEGSLSKSEFEYWNYARDEWRRVNNYTQRSKLFDIFRLGVDA